MNALAFLSVAKTLLVELTLPFSCNIMFFTSKHAKIQLEISSLYKLHFMFNALILMGLVLCDIIKHMAVFCMPFISSNLINNVKTRRK